jgi:hypothetical protein
MTDQLLTDELIEATNEQSPVEQSPVEQSPVDESPVDGPQDFSNNDRKMTELEMLIARRTGFFPVALQMDDIKWIKNACNSEKFKFEGPNEAFMIMNCYMGFAAALARLDQEASLNVEPSGKVEIQAAAIEAAAIMISRYEGSGLELAKRVFRIAVALNGPAMEMKRLDNEIETLKPQTK